MTFPAIEKGIPIPPAKGSATKSAIVRAMAVGDSILVANRREANVYTAIFSRLRLKVSRRICPDGVRLWRTK